ncbi:MAG: CocE/NonD family hydrolase C-terminal non-catalytic domain-containing protein, partial [Stenotrophomonas sp.]
NQPKAITPGAPQTYSFDLPNVNQTLQPGHRLMVQVQSSLFPLYDRNPQKYVDNIFFAQPGDYRKATQRIWNSSEHPSYITLPVVE